MKWNYLILLSLLFLSPIVYPLDIDIEKAMPNKPWDDVDREKVVRKRGYLTSFYKPLIVKKIEGCYKISGVHKKKIKGKSVVYVNMLSNRFGEILDLDITNSAYPEVIESVDKMIRSCAPFPEIPSFEGEITDMFSLKMRFEIYENKTRKQFPIKIMYSN